MIEIPFKSSVVNSLEHVVFFTIISQMVKHIGFTNISELNVFFWVYKYLSMVGNVNTTKLHDLKVIVSSRLPFTPHDTNTVGWITFHLHTGAFYFLF